MLLSNQFLVMLHLGYRMVNACIAKATFFLFVNDCTGYAAKAVDGCVAFVTDDICAMYNIFIYANPP